jgi:uncharacterized membrane protein YagU involved in acid resistance
MAASVTCDLPGVFACRCNQIGIAAKPRASSVQTKGVSACCWQNAGAGAHAHKGRKPVNAAKSSAESGITAKPNDVGDVAFKVVAGLAAGALGVWALDRLDWFMWDQEDPETRARTTAARPQGEPPAQALVSKVEDTTGKQLEASTHEAVSQVVHYTIGIAPAIGYALLRDKLPMSGVARGALYGAGLFLTQDEVLNTVTGLGAKPQDYPWQAHARGIIAHTTYGIVTELALALADTIRADRTHADVDLSVEQS